MNKEHVPIELLPVWFMKMFGGESYTCELVSEGIAIQSEKRERYVIHGCILQDDNLILKSGLLSSKLTIQTDKGPKTIRGLSKKNALHVYLKLRDITLKQKASEITQDYRSILKQIVQSYPSTYRIQAAVSLAKKSFAKFNRISDQSWPADIDAKPFKFIAAIACKREDILENIKKQYVDSQLKIHKDYFDTVESLPLTERQREACVIDEDNNLVLAGAGTGKTSTIVGRAGYLIESNQAKPNEILLLAFGNKAAKEMQERIALRIGDCGITTNTFHKLGMTIIAEAEGKKPSISPLAEDERKLVKQVNQWFEKHLKDKKYHDRVIKYFHYYLYPEANPFDFESKGEYFDYLIANEIRTLKGEKVKSQGECLIANYLYGQGIEYAYEKRYEHETATIDHSQYKPDFYLPKHGIYIEYFGVDRNDKTAPYLNRKKYLESMVWKRELHRAHKTNLIELFHYENIEGVLYESIDKQLEQFEVEYNPLPDEALLGTLREFGAISSFSKLLTDLLKRYRANCFESGQLEIQLNKADNKKQVTAALSLLEPIHHDYEDLLRKHGHIDFDDMIHRAINYIKYKHYKSQWRYILVDEFQDISEPRARLVKSIIDSRPGTSLFCVGDDWQAIYRFTGSDLTFTTRFEGKFGPTKITKLDKTFRFNNSICDVSSRFVLRNPEQIEKQLITHTKVDKPAVTLFRASNGNRNRCEENEILEQVLAKISQNVEKTVCVYILSRYSFNLPNDEYLKKLSNRFRNLSVETHTIHASKGKEADYVILLGLEKGKNGFPSEKQTHPLLEALLPPMESYAHAEERRLFYVAITRAKKHAYLIADMLMASSFIVELINEKYPIVLDEFEVSLHQKIGHLLNCPKCKTGILTTKQSKYGAFHSCNKYPLCEYKEVDCPGCEMPMSHISGRFKLCVNPDCDTWLPICPECGSTMTELGGPYGKFWGCRNYRKDKTGCNHKENEIIYDKNL